MAHCIVAVLVPDSEPDAQAAASAVLLAQPPSLLDGFYFVEPREHVNMVFADGVLWARDRWEQRHEGGRPMTDEGQRAAARYAGHGCRVRKHPLLRWRPLALLARRVTLLPRSMSILDTVKHAAATLTDTLASLAEKVPPLAQVTLSAGGASVTVTPKPPEQPKCPQCGK